MIKAVIFDLGGVLIENPVVNIFHYWAKLLNVSYDDVRNAFGPHIRAYDRGDLNSDGLLEIGTNKLGVKHNLSHTLFYDSFKKYYNPDREMFSLARQLQESGYKVGLLSNIGFGGIKYLEEDAKEEFTFFDAIVLSASENVSKPENRIYELMIKRIKVKPEEAVFTDDRMDNCQGAIDYGIKAIKFNNINQLKEELKKLEIKIKN